ncbi:MAG: GIY-YIG nuclease family protein [candidate division Zixibacteria bacterium]|nr:GIY-YIG nuclease family protein [candidate division Zixibacteria bacterium]MBU1471717.1 GIY-YIG nuclease family protein [candidate division Zixibacteria bacterium]
MRISTRFTSLTPPLSSAEYSQLEASILAEGCRDTLVTWNGILLDGHHRLQICEKHGLPFQATSIELEDEAAAKVWILKNQLGRRNLAPYQKMELVLQLEPLLSAKAKDIMSQAAADRQAKIRKINEELHELPSWDSGNRYGKECELKALGREADNADTANNQLVYFIESNGKIKIGVSTFPEARLKQLKTGNPDAVLLASVPGGRFLEKELHIRHEIDRCSGEWFNKSAALMDDIVGLSNTDKPTGAPFHVRQELVKLTKFGSGTLARVKVISEKADEATKEQLRKGETTINKVYTSILNDERKATNREKKNIAPPEGLYNVIVIDPPWPIKKVERDCRPNQSAELDYPTMPLELISSIHIPKADDCHLFCWTTNKLLPETIKIVEGWGFRYVLTMVWHKPGGFQPVGLPQYNCEFIIYARYGHPEFTDTKAFNVCFDAPRGKHSEKPEEFYRIIARVTEGERLDMFSRRQIEGFDVWGNEV